MQACPNGAISIAIVDVADAWPARRPPRPGAPSSAITVPTTVYRTARGRRLEAPADHVDRARRPRPTRRWP